MEVIANMPTNRAFKAKYLPTRPDDLNDSLKPFIGKELEFKHAWTMHDHHTFPNEDVFLCQHEDFGYWVPARDLQRVSTGICKFIKNLIK